MEVYENATAEVSFEDTGSFKVSTLAGIVILKLVSYDDRPEIRSEDIKDIGAILMHFFELESESIYENHFDLFEAEERDLLRISARVVGRQMRQVLTKNGLLKKRILDILTGNTLSAATSEIGRLLQVEDRTLEYQVTILKEIIAGISEER